MADQLSDRIRHFSFEAERTRQMEEVRIAVQQALTAARRAGSVAAGIERLAAETLEPQIPWPEVLAKREPKARSRGSWSAIGTEAEPRSSEAQRASQ